MFKVTADTIDGPFAQTVDADTLKVQSDALDNGHLYSVARKLKIGQTRTISTATATIKVERV